MRSAISVALVGLISTMALGSDAGTTGANILNIPLGTRAVGMGEAYTAMADDASSLYWNPAGLALMTQSEASFMYNNWLQGLNLSNVSVGTPLENGGIGVSGTYESFGNIDGFNAVGDPTGNVNAYSGVATVGGAWLGENWSAGASAKAIQTKLADVSATAFASDLGATYIYPNEVLQGTIRAGASIRNLGTSMKFISESDPLPLDFRVGVAGVNLFMDHLNVSMDLDKTRDNTTSLYSGVEYWPMKMIALRAGYAGNHSESNGLRAGLGLKAGVFNFDYSYGSFGDLGMTNRFELTYRFGAMRPLLTPEERRILRRAKVAMRTQQYGEATMLFDSLLNLEPRYTPARKYEQEAMSHYEGDERAQAKANEKNFTAMKTVVRSNGGDSSNESDELQKLLELGDDSKAAKAK